MMFGSRARWRLTVRRLDMNRSPENWEYVVRSKPGTTIQTARFIRVKIPTDSGYTKFLSGIVTFLFYKKKKIKKIKAFGYLFGKI